METKKRLPAKERRRVIIHAAIDVFSESNFQVAKVADISERAGISDAMVYKFFDSKQELFLEILRKTSKNTLENYLAANREDFKDVKDKMELRNFIRESLMLYFNSMEKYRKEIKIYFQAISEINNPDVQQVLKHAYQMYADYYDSVLQKAKEKNLIDQNVNTTILAWDIIGFTIHQSTLFVMDFNDKTALEIFLSQRLESWIE